MRKNGSKNETNKKLFAAIIAVTMCVAVFLPIANASGTTISKTTNEILKVSATSPTPNKPNGRGLIKNLNTNEEFGTIQGAIDDSDTLDGHTIQVSAGIYNETQIIINKALTIQGAGWASTIIDGSDAELTACGLIRIIATGDVAFAGFTVQNAGGPTNGEDYGDDLTNVGIYTESPSSLSTYYISENKIIGTNNADDWQDYGLYTNSGLEHLIFSHNTITQTSGNAVLIEKHPGSTEISYNTLDAGCYGIDPIFYMTYAETNITTLQNISSNTIDVGTGSGGDKATAISFVSSYSGSGPLGDGKYMNILISNNIINNLGDLKRGISLYNDAYGDGIAGGISNATIKGNIITGNTGSSPNFGIRLAGLVINTIIRDNQIMDCDMSFYGTVGQNSPTVYPTDIHINYNIFKNNAQGLVWQGSTQLDAKYNYWGDGSGPTFAADPVSGNVLYIPFIDHNPPWEATLNFEKQGTGYTWDTAIFGEKITASDGQDTYDVPKPTIPPTPYIYAYFDARLSDPYQRLWKDYRHFLHEQETWDFYVQSNTNTGITNVVISWSIANINGSEYDFVDLYDATNNHLADMKTQNTYILVGLPDNTPIHLKVKCGVNHIPVAFNDVAIANENSTNNQINVLINDLDVDCNVLTIASVTQPTHGTSSTDGSYCYYTPTASNHGTDSFTYTISDGFGGSATATVSLPVVQLHTLNIHMNWNLISIPCDTSIAKTDIIVRHNGNDYSWAEAVSNNYIISTLFGWNRSSQAYFLADTLLPGQGYWCWANNAVDFYIWSDAVGAGHITNLKTHWNIIGLPYETPINTANLLVEYNSNTYTWNEAIANQIVLGFVYGWNANLYTLETTLSPDEGYWMYAYHDCILKRII